MGGMFSSVVVVRGGWVEGGKVHACLCRGFSSMLYLYRELGVVKIMGMAQLGRTHLVKNEAHDLKYTNLCSLCCG